MRRLPSFLVLALISLHIYHGYSQSVTCATGQFLVEATNECVATCPAATYITTQGTQQACAQQTAITATPRLIPEENSILVMFNSAQLPFQDPTDAVTVSMVQSDGTLVDLNAVSTFLNADTLKTVFSTPPTYKEVNLAISFTDYTVINTSPSYIVSPVVMPYLVFASPDNNDPNVVEHLTKLDRGLEWAWIAVTTLNPYAFLYMNTKLYRETLEVFKRTNVRFGVDATNFFQQNNNKVSGYKAANMFPILLMDDPVSSGWNRESVNALPTADMNEKRFNDLRLPSTDSVYTYDPYALFLDNYGSQITVFFGFAALIIAFEFLNIILCCNRRRAGPSKVVKLFQAIRIFLRWNILIACIIGSFQTLMYYFMVQMQVKALASTDQDNNLKLNFWFAIGTIIILGVFFPLILAFKLRSIYRRRLVDKEPIENDKFWGIFTSVLNFERRSSLFFIFVLMLRTPVFAALTLFLDYKPVAQIAVMLAFSVIFTIIIMVLRPFKRLFHTIFQLLNELVLIAFLCVLLFLAHQADKDTVSDHEAVSTGDVLIAFWMLVPTLGIVFGLMDIMRRLFLRRKQKQAAAKYTVEIAQHSSQSEPAQKIVEKGEHTPGVDHHARPVGGSVETTEPLPIVMPTMTENPDLEALQTSQDSIEGGKKTNTLQIEATPSRRAFPNLSYIEGIDTIVEDPEKEQASANLKDEGNKRKVKDNSLQNISMGNLGKSIFATPEQNEPVVKPKEIEPERRENMRMLNPMNPLNHMSNYGPSLNASRNVTEADPNRTQDKIKAAPLSLDMPMSMRTSRIQESERRPKSVIFGNSNGFQGSSNGFQQSGSRFLPMDALNRSDMTNRSLMNLDTVPTNPARNRPLNEEGYKNVNKRLIFE